MKMLPEKSVTSYCVQFENEPDTTKKDSGRHDNHINKCFCWLRYRACIN